MDEMFPATSDVLQQFVGVVITKKMLFGRGYFHVRDGNVIEAKFPRSADFELLDDYVLEEFGSTDGFEYPISSRMVKRYIATELDGSEYDESDYWVKSIPAEHYDITTDEGYIVICIATEPTEEGLKITNIMCLDRIMDKPLCGSFYDMDSITMESIFYKMEIIQAETYEEISNLIKGRYITSDFSLLGKPLPENQEKINLYPTYSIRKNSSWRNVYYELLMYVDEEERIENIEFNTHVRDELFSLNFDCLRNDKADILDAVLQMCDSYSDDEWNNITSNE